MLLRPGGALSLPTIWVLRSKQLTQANPDQDGAGNSQRDEPGAPSERRLEHPGAD